MMDAFGHVRIDVCMTTNYKTFSQVVIFPWTTRMVNCNILFFLHSIYSSVQKIKLNISGQLARYEKKKRAEIANAFHFIKLILLFFKSAVLPDHQSLRVLWRNDYLCL